jgi:hypothetical protein
MISFGFEGLVFESWSGDQLPDTGFGECSQFVLENDE